MKLNVSLPNDLAEEVRARAREQGISATRYVAQALIHEERRRNFDAWADEAMARNPPSEKDIAEVRAVFERARRRAREQPDQRVPLPMKAE